MTGSHPCLRVHEDSAVETHIVLVLLHELLCPCALDVVFQFHAEGTVIPCVRKAAVDLAARVDEAASLTERDKLVHCFFGVLHFYCSFRRIDCLYYSIFM